MAYNGSPLPGNQGIHHEERNGGGYRTDAGIRCITVTGSGQGTRDLAGNMSI